MTVRTVRLLCLVISIMYVHLVKAQFREGIKWTPDGNGYYNIKAGNIVKTDPKTESETVVIKKEQLIPAGQAVSLNIASFVFNSNNTKLLIFTNTAKVWRYNTRGDYWILDMTTNKLVKLGSTRPSQSLMYAKFSNSGKKVAYVSEHNIFVEDLVTNTIKQLTSDGTRKMINGTFDWVYEEEFGCRDGFRWSAGDDKIAYWQVNATKIRDYYMLNTTDSVYSKVIPVEYPKTGEAPSPVRIGVVNLANSFTRWMDIEGDPRQHYLPRMEWADENTLVVQQLDRRQQESKLMYCDAQKGSAVTFYAEDDTAWVDIKSRWNDDDPRGWDWINNKENFLWVSEKDGWRHIYLVSRDGAKETLLTTGKYDIAAVKNIDETNGYVYFLASPDNATQLYLYRVKLDGHGNAELITPASLKGTHNYSISPNGRLALHSFSNYKTFPVSEWLTLPENKPLVPAKSIAKNIRTDESINVEYTKIATEDGITVDAWINKPKHFDSTKKYPVVFYVYGEAAATVTDDVHGGHDNVYGLYDGDMSIDGYFQVAVDNRGTPSLKGAAWRKAIYRKNGIVNIRDMAMAAKKLLERRYFDKDRVAVWGWSSGGTSTLQLLFQYPEIFKTGIAISAITNLLFYDNIYTERYMGLPQENMENYIKAAALNYAKNLQGNLLYIHGTGDDNVHYDNAEALVNELVKYNKQFRYMTYPGRTHDLSEGEGTTKHLSTLYTSYLKTNCSPGPR